MADKKRFDYSLVGLVKADHVTTFETAPAYTDAKGKAIPAIICGIDDLDTNAQKVLANYGLFVMLTRTLAGHEADTNTEKKELMTKTWDWLKESCPKREKVMISAYEAACNKVNASTASAKEKASTLAVLKTAFGK
jgi:hypothetical protein